jgi:hypothetical protein
VTAKMSFDQHAAMAVHLRRKMHGMAAEDPLRSAVRVRAKSFLALARTARDDDWPSSATAPFYVLTQDEAASAWTDRGTRQRVFFPRLTATEIARLRQKAKDTSAFARTLYPHLMRVPGAKKT